MSGKKLKITLLWAHSKVSIASWQCSEGFIFMYYGGVRMYMWVGPDYREGCGKRLTATLTGSGLQRLGFLQRLGSHHPFFSHFPIQNAKNSPTSTSIHNHHIPLGTNIFPYFHRSDSNALLIVFFKHPEFCSSLGFTAHLLLVSPLNRGY